VILRADRGMAILAAIATGEEKIEKPRYLAGCESCRECKLPPLPYLK
jgi:hypothetical protein